MKPMDVPLIVILLFLIIPHSLSDSSSFHTGSESKTELLSGPFSQDSSLSWEALEGAEEFGENPLFWRTYHLFFAGESNDYGRKNKHSEPSLNSLDPFSVSQWNQSVIYISTPRSPPPCATSYQSCGMTKECACTSLEFGFGNAAVRGLRSVVVGSGLHMLPACLTNALAHTTSSCWLAMWSMPTRPMPVTRVKLTMWRCLERESTRLLSLTALKSPG